MTLAIMQPYIFPYIGYFQLIHAVDRFVFYDDVNYIKQGWINRNRILLNGKEHMFTVPLQNASSFATIAQTHIDHKHYERWRDKLFKTLELAYSKAPCYANAMDVIAPVFNTRYDTISELATQSVTETCSYLGINKEFVLTAIEYRNKDLRGKDRVIDICARERADTYINAAGGKELYDKKEFAQNGLQLFFLKTRNVTYSQFGEKFVPWLSVIDVMMFNPAAMIREFLAEYDFE